MMIFHRPASRASMPAATARRAHHLIGIEVMAGMRLNSRLIRRRNIGHRLAPPARITCDRRKIGRDARVAQGRAPREGAPGQHRLAHFFERARLMVQRNSLVRQATVIRFVLVA